MREDSWYARQIRYNLCVQVSALASSAVFFVLGGYTLALGFLTSGLIQIGAATIQAYIGLLILPQQRRKWHELRTVARHIRTASSLSSPF